MKLTNKQAAFIDEYLIDFNATQAAIRAGYSEKAAYSQGQRLLNNVETQKAIQEAMIERRKANGVTRDSIASEIDDMTAISKQYASEGNTQALNAWIKAIETKAKLYGFYDRLPEEKEEDSGMTKLLLLLLTLERIVAN